MPGKSLEQQSVMVEQSCRRCRTNPAVLVVRTEPVCGECFSKYVHTKVIKRMESFRVRFTSPDQLRKILLPISFGISSVSLLHILDRQLQTQKSKTGRTGYSLHVIHVDTSSVEPSAPDAGLLSQLKDRYPHHIYASVPLHELFMSSADGSPSEAYKDLTEDSSLEDMPADQKLLFLIGSLPSATARADVISTLRTRLLVQCAKDLGCEGILWGDSTTRLAEKTLAETAKGRGFALPWQIGDGDSPFGLTFNYPVRDLLKKELTAYASITEPPLFPLIYEPPKTSQPAPSSKSTTIDDLMKQYFESVEENFPSIVSNVVRTTTKLEAPSTFLSEARCKLCNMPVADGRFGIHGWGGDQEDGLDISGKPSRELCYGCTRSVPPTVTLSQGVK
ncbi:hypothetical protein GQ43DRAFT_201446 [Delitschia confertaspora ATCC 74209]|uniref:Cytoplasmic tRNA 2-thiolation protein 2 n=1 Tax=Delitschia confertaspora ATCC 74209 TaxID=1513339 RepID=A0A9P4JX67_9PLEO|nr:hypothetical protein GQ43DRAFT_201446 [Delitschia confertaspora ATCC 74209]